MERKFRFYEQHGVEEYYVYDPDDGSLEGWRRVGNHLEAIPQMAGYVSPRLGIRFDPGEGPDNLRIFHPDGTRFLTFDELDEERKAEKRRADKERQCADELARVAGRRTRSVPRSKPEPPWPERQRAEEQARVADEERQRRGRTPACRGASPSRRRRTQPRRRRTPVRRRRTPTAPSVWPRGYENSAPKPISTPAGLPCRVITISSVSARCRYFERSSFTSESGTVFIALTYLFEPCIRIGFRDDREDLNLFALDVIKDPKVMFKLYRSKDMGPNRGFSLRGKCVRFEFAVRSALAYRFSRPK